MKNLYMHWLTVEVVIEKQHTNNLPAVTTIAPSVHPIESKEPNNAHATYPTVFVYTFSPSRVRRIVWVYRIQSASADYVE